LMFLCVMLLILLLYFQQVQVHWKQNSYASSIEFSSLEVLLCFLFWEGVSHLPGVGIFSPCNSECFFFCYLENKLIFYQNRSPDTKNIVFFVSAFLCPITFILCSNLGELPYFIWSLFLSYNIVFPTSSLDLLIAFFFC
jgi:hypothetical protein